MDYITPDDLKAFLDEREIAALKRDYEKDQVDKLDIGITYALNFVRDRLSFFNIEAEYQNTGDARNTTLIEIVCHIAIWKLTATFPMIQLDGKRHEFYKEAIANLDKIAKGLIVISTLEPKNSDSLPSDIKYGYSTETENII